MAIFDQAFIKLIKSWEGEHVCVRGKGFGSLPYFLYFLTYQVKFFLYQASFGFKLFVFMAMCGSKYVFNEHMLWGGGVISRR